VVGDKGAGTGGQTVDTVLASGSFIDLLRNRSILMQAGARVLAGLVGDVAIPKQTGAATMYWVGENGAPTESTPTLGQVALTPHTAAAYTQFSRKLMLQSSIDVEAFIRDDLSNVLRIGIDFCALNGDADTDAPDGIADLAGINVVDFTTAARPTWAEVIDCWTQVAIDNADIGTLGYLMGPAMAGYLMSTPKVTGDATMMMTSRAELAGYRALISTQAAAGDLWFGNWADLIFGFWSGLDIMADPYSAATSGATRVVAFQDVDYGARNVVSFCRGKHIP
jgi:HK97 family phage major capsid protein